MTGETQYDAIIIGGGFYGCAIALYLRQYGFEKVMVLERENNILCRASYTNQARVHNGYHYPRSFITAYRSRINLPRFINDYGFAVKRDFTKLYAIAAKRSKVTARQFERFMQDIGASYRRADAEHTKLFDPRLISAVYVTEEYAFDSSRLRNYFEKELATAEVQLHLNSEVTNVCSTADNVVVTERSESGENSWSAKRVFNCTYANLNRVLNKSEDLTPLKHELTEMLLVEPPPELERIGVTVMDGPFFSCMPFPAENCYSLSHVRYTPHGTTFDSGRHDAFPEKKKLPAAATKAAYMIADSTRYLPAMAKTKYLKSLFDIKTVLVRNEVDDGRPILLRRESGHHGVFSILGGKIDNIYDILDKMEGVLGQRTDTISAPKVES